MGGSFTDMRYDEMAVRGPIADNSQTFAGEKAGLTNDSDNTTDIPTEGQKNDLLTELGPANCEGQ